MNKLVSGVIASLLFSCTATWAQQPVELRMSWWGGNSRHQATLKALEAFEKKYPDIKVKAEYTGWDGHLSRLTTQIASGTEPDVMQTNWPWLIIFSKNGEGYYDLNKLKDQLDLSQYQAKDLQSTTVKGKLNGLPISVNAPVFYYNDVSWKKAGLAYPKTWDELFAAGKVFQQKLGDNYYPYAMVDQDVILLLNAYMMQKYQKPMFDNDGKFTWDDAQWAEAFSFVKRLSDDRVVPSPKKLSSYGKGNLYEMKPWIAGEWGGTFTWNISIRMYINNLTPPAHLVLGDYVMQPGTTESGVYFKTAQMFSVAKSTRHPKEAAMLVNFLLNDPQSIAALGLERGIPLSKAAETLLTQQGVIDPNDPVVAGLRQAQALPTTVVATPYIEDLQVVDQFMSAREKLDQGNQTPAQVAADFRQQVERIVRRLNRGA
ncbi:sugar ABC transporter substrate-binding protein [Klebsiella sp. WP7-S18-CRE-02]|uniref:Sugar ABC transporter substrate-binding protein n=2 Tax=Enterobacterales TaxID=91347 RepID=A0A2T2XZK0_9ENTR|nr:MULTISPECIES: ABC transporter substrate-binding protein [Enterobacteriaceae]HAT3919911.1 carbohydrate ABC transporter substrate-binding protein [Kluyvera ascorbata]PSR45724.1 sugar ABC transporter substrate-binding protein [Kluyvera genomosp. 2]BBQ85928.1 sugar ABC transporter substrate-binding protein [Klebsiella sp. WP3-W18-ESBL-02]BBR22911.1 sugar ABC transporter substrate-binding protein [Klebsiella sp. WP3-S18-ESBL-05]BBR60933.1 sugar ABC transporter substrate-binding protein [Klebsiel